jgi:6-pyruvoyltetrahydropterin/6-carboxytetrahydropterin synthase
MYECAKVFEFCAAHYNPQAGAEHHCSRLHGHSWAVRFVFQGMSLDHRAWLFDFGLIRDRLKPIVDSLDHRCLNDLFEFNPSAELLAQWFASQVEKTLCPDLINCQVSLLRVDVTERAGDWKAWASYIL